jgi:hypothetical protein
LRSESLNRDLNLNLISEIEIEKIKE